MISFDEINSEDKPQDEDEISEEDHRKTHNSNLFFSDTDSFNLRKQVAFYLEKQDRRLSKQEDLFEWNLNEFETSKEFNFYYPKYNMAQLVKMAEN